MSTIVRGLLKTLLIKARYKQCERQYRFWGVSGINKGTIKDVVNEGDVKIYKEGTMGGNSVGGISGNNIDKGTIENAVNKGAILGGVAVGGIVGENSGSIRNTENSGNIIGVISAAGGIVGRNANGKGRSSRPLTAVM